MSQRQHTVPRNYLVGFSDPKGRLSAFDRQEQRQLFQSVNNASVVKDIYRLPGGASGGDSQQIERLLGEAESAAATILEKVRNGKASIGSASREALAGLISLQLSRTSKRRQEVQELGDRYAKLWSGGLTRSQVKERLQEHGKDPTESDVSAVMELVQHPERFRFVPPDGSFLLMFLKSYEQTLPLVREGWNWIVVHPQETPFLTSDHPIVMVGDSLDGGLGLENADEIWLPVGRRHAIVLSRDFSLPPIVLGLEPDHVGRINKRIAQEAYRWIFWHPDDDLMESSSVPPRRSMLRFETVGWRSRPDGTIGEIKRIGPNRPVISGECLIGGRQIVDRQAEYSGLVSREQAILETNDRPQGT